MNISTKIFFLFVDIFTKIIFIRPKIIFIRTKMNSVRTFWAHEDFSSARRFFFVRILLRTFFEFRWR